MAPKSCLVAMGHLRSLNMYGHSQADIVAVGETEGTVLELLEAILTGKDLAEVKGITYKDGVGDIRRNERRKPIMKIDQIPFPAWDLFPMDIYTTNIEYHLQNDDEKGMQILIGRGCVNRCTFCYRMQKGVSFFCKPNYSLKEKKR